MPDPASKSLPSIGFLAAVEHPAYGAFGGYLIVNGAGRPLEFHCTAPVKPNRAQEILYGPTLAPYLFGEQIGQTLINKAALRPMALLTDTGAMLAIRDFVDLPTALVTGGAALAADAVETSSGGQLIGSTYNPPTANFEFADRQLSVLRDFADDQAAIIARLAPLAVNIDLAEPFQRIREAIQEANRAA